MKYYCRDCSLDFEEYELVLMQPEEFGDDMIKCCPACESKWIMEVYDEGK